MKKIDGKIYILTDTINNELKYVGQTISELKKRLRGHLNDKKSNYKNCWIKNILKKNGNIIIEQIDSSDNLEKLNELEIFYISYFKYLGFKLTNISEGGRNSINSIETRLKISNSKKGFKHSDETKEKLRQINLGKKQSDEVLEIRSKSMKLKWKDPVYQKKVSDSLSGDKNPFKGKKHSDETKEKMKLKKKIFYDKKKIFILFNKKIKNILILKITKQNND